MSARHTASATPVALRLLDAFATVDLEELNVEAELQTRVDRKYMLPIEALPAVLEQLPGEARVLEVAGNRAMAYQSVYFDTPELTSFLLAARARRRRFKIRTRSYVDSAASFLEVKTRGGRALTVKDRIPVDTVATAALSGEARAYADHVLADSGIDGLGAVLLEPTLTTAYRRATVLLPAAGGRPPSRATIDVDLRWTDRGRDGQFGRSLTTPASAIVETKSGARAGAVDRALWAAGHRPTRVSKYATGLAALRPGLPANRWTRVLDRHFRLAITESTP